MFIPARSTAGFSFVLAGGRISIWFFARIANLCRSHVPVVGLHCSSALQASRHAEPAETIRLSFDCADSHESSRYRPDIVVHYCTLPKEQLFSSVAENYFASEEYMTFEQIPFGTNSFAENPEPRVPCILLLDVSSSMAGTPITELNAGLVTYKDELAADSLASKRVEVSIVTFGERVETACDFTTADQFFPPTLQANGYTPMGAAINLAIDMVTQRKQVYRSNGILFYRPWIFMITDGAPTDQWQTAAERIKQGEASKAFSFFSVGTAEANFDILKQLSVREPLKLKGLRFRDLFNWLSNSQQSVSRSTPGEEVPLENPTSPSGWATV